MKKKSTNLTTYVITGDPIPLARVHYSRHTSKRFDSQKQMKLIHGISLRSQHNEQKLYTGPLHLNVTFNMRIYPNSERKYHHHVYKPDLDNMIKWICDIANGILYDDDCIISCISARKVYDENPRTEFTLEVIE
jgi:Holliday junction resolvase RusA-like endonuclease